MLKDIKNYPQIVTVDGKEYKFEFDHAAMAILENNTDKSIYEIYDYLTIKNGLLLNDLYAFIEAGLLKHHEVKEILDLKNKLIEYPGIWNEIKHLATFAFLFPMFPPKIMKKLEGNIEGKKKQLKVRQKKTTNG